VKIVNNPAAIFGSGLVFWYETGTLNTHDQALCDAAAGVTPVIRENGTQDGIEADTSGAGTWVPVPENSILTIDAGQAYIHALTQLLMLDHVIGQI